MFPMKIFWLSFCDPDRPKGEQFLGVSIVGGYDPQSAVRRAHQLGCNPGGECLFQEFPSDIAARVDPKWMDRLLDRAESKRIDRILLESVS